MLTIKVHFWSIVPLSLTLILQKTEQRPQSDTPTIENRIIGGELVKEGEFPSVVALDIRKADGQYLCSGTFISSRYVLTAGHCIYRNTRITVLIGCVDRSRCDTRRDGKGILHPDYRDVDRGLVLNDIALIRLYSRIRPPGIANLSTSSNSVNGCVVVGFGSTDIEGSENKRLYKLQITTVLPCAVFIFMYDTEMESLLCSSGDPSNQFYLGDSGGPLFCGRHQVGVTSHSATMFMNTSVVMAWVSVSYYRDWFPAAMCACHLLSMASLVISALVFTRCA